MNADDEDLKALALFLDSEIQDDPGTLVETIDDSKSKYKLQ